MGLFESAKRILATLFGSTASKGEAELAYWKKRVEKEGALENKHYKAFYTSHFDLTEADWVDKVVIDIGCGPRGSLEWADMTKERYGLDPLADKYLELGASEHKMRYVVSGAERIPFADGYFDILTSFNNIDHVDDLDRTIAEIKRVVKPGGMFLLLTEVGHEPTPTEPIVLDFDIASKFRPEFEVLNENHFEKFQNGIYQSLNEGKRYDHDNRAKRYGIVSAKFRKVTSS
jgi:ubiquinone/menaquinone biosynthesis C-methylase UbiE